MPTPFERRFVARAGADAHGFGQAVAQRYGFPPQIVTRLLALAAKLSSPGGGKIDQADLQMLCATHPQTDPHWLAAAAQQCNAQPAHLRGRYFVAALTSDMNVLNDNMVGAGAAYQEVDNLVQQYMTQDFASAVDAKRGGSQDASPPWQPEYGSVRDLVSRAMEPPGYRALAAAVERGNPHAEAVARHALADGIEDAGERLRDDSSSRRDTVAAAFDMAEATEVASAEFGVDGGGAQ